MSSGLLFYILVAPALFVLWKGLQYVAGRAASLERIANAYLFSELKKYNIRREDIPPALTNFICTDSIHQAQLKALLSDEDVQLRNKAFDGNSVAVRVQLARLIEVWAGMIAGYVHSQDLDRPQTPYHEAFERFHLRRRWAGSASLHARGAASPPRIHAPKN
jgi:hypothetical protein